MWQLTVFQQLSWVTTASLEGLKPQAPSLRIWLAFGVLFTSGRRCGRRFIVRLEHLVLSAPLCLAANAPHASPMEVVALQLGTCKGGGALSQRGWTEEVGGRLTLPCWQQRPHYFQLSLQVKTMT